MSVLQESASPDLGGGGEPADADGDGMGVGGIRGRTFLSVRGAQGSRDGQECPYYKRARVTLRALNEEKIHRSLLMNRSRLIALILLAALAGLAGFASQPGDPPPKPPVVAPNEVVQYFP